MESSTPDSQNSVDLASHACATCTKRKRKCDKKLPQCGFCEKSRRKCLYRRLRPRLWQEPDGVLTSLHPSTALPTATAAAQQTPPVCTYFLDYDIFFRGHMQTLKADTPVPAYVDRLIGNTSDIQRDASAYFSTIHLWWSIISKQRFYDQYLNPLLPRRLDIALLFLCIKLITWTPDGADQDPRTQLYRVTKQYYTELETVGVFSLQALQSAVLIAVYELGHGIYLSACSTASACVRYGEALGINWRPRIVPTQPMSFMDLEERRRAWWATFILDRFVSVGSPGRGLAAEDPSPTELLPSNDEAWDKGTISPDDYVTLSEPSSVDMGRFARLAHATHLLGQAIHQIYDPSSDLVFHDEAGRQLERTIQALIRICPNDPKSPKIGQTVICHSALYALYGPTLAMDPGTPDDLQRWHHANKVLEAASTKIASISAYFRQGFGQPVKEIAPFVFYCLYQAAVYFVHRPNGIPGEERADHLAAIKEVLKKCDNRWRAAGIYLRILEARLITDCQ